MKEVEVWTIGNEVSFYILIDEQCYLLYNSMLHNWNIVVLRNAVFERQTPYQSTIHYTYETIGYDYNNLAQSPFEYIVRPCCLLHLLVTQGITAQEICDGIERLNRRQATKTFIKKAKGYE